MGERLIVRHEWKRLPHQVHTPPRHSNYAVQQLALSGTVVASSTGQTFTIELDRMPSITMLLLKDSTRSIIRGIR